MTTYALFSRSFKHSLSRFLWRWQMPKVNPTIAKLQREYERRAARHEPTKAILAEIRRVNHERFKRKASPAVGRRYALNLDQHDRIVVELELGPWPEDRTEVRKSA